MRFRSKAQQVLADLFRKRRACTSKGRWRETEKTVVKGTGNIKELELQSGNNRHLTGHC